MKKNIILSLTFLYAGLILVTSASAAGGGAKIATMDLKKVLELSTVGQSVQAKVKQKYDEYQGKLSGKEEELVALQGEIEKKRTVWSAELLNQKERDLKRGIQDLQTETKYADNDMQEYQKKQVGPILNELEGIIDSYGKKNGLSVILDTTRGILYQDEALDISSEIAAELDKKHAAEPAAK